MVMRDGMVGRAHGSSGLVAGGAHVRMLCWKVEGRRV